MEGQDGVSGGGGGGGGYDDNATDRQQQQQQQEQHLQMRRLSYTTPATPFVGTPAGAPHYNSASHADNSSNHDENDIYGGEEDERKMPAAATGGTGGSAGTAQPVAVDSHLHLDDIRHPPHPSNNAAAHAASAASTANAAAGHAAGGSASAARAVSASATASPSQPHPQQQHPHPTPQTRSSALLSAQYYASCALASIPPNLADRAVKSAHAAFKYWWDQDRIAERMVGEGDAEVTGVRVQAHQRRDSESSVSINTDYATDLSIGGGNHGAAASGGGGMMASSHRHGGNHRHPTGGGGGGGVGATGAMIPQESFDESSVASSMMREAAAAATASASASASAAAPAAPIPMAISVNPQNSRSNNMGDSSSSPAQQRLGGSKRGRRHSAHSMHSTSAHGDALWATDTEDEDNTAAADDRARKRQKSTPVAGPAPPPSHHQQTQQQQIPARTEMVRSEMASFLKQQRYRSELQQTKTALLHALQMTGGDVTSEPFLHSLKRLRGLYKRSGLDCRSRVVSSSAHANTSVAAGTGAAVVDETATPQLEGMWLTLSRPNFHDCLGLNEQREYMYTLGRMSFGMYKPTNIVCSVQGTFNPIHRVDSADVDEVESVPRSLRKELHEGRSLLRTYNIVTAFSIEPASPLFGENSPNVTVTRPIRGIMTTYGYILPDPSTPNRLSVWFTGGTVEVDDEGDADEWKRIFGGSSAAAAANAGPMAPPRPGPSLSERAKMLAAKLLLGASVPHGMEDDGSMHFQLKRPVGGHGSTYVDTIYLDDTLRIMQGHHGSLFVMARVPGS